MARAATRATCLSLPMALALTGAVTLAPHTAHGAACCMSATAVGVGRLVLGERFAVGIRSSFAAGIGEWNAHAEFEAHSEAFTDHEWRSELWSMVGLGQRASIYLRVPWQLNYRRAGNLGDGVGGGFGDLQAGARYELLAVGESSWMPALATTLGVLLPTGRAVDEAAGAGDALGKSVTGRGAWAVTGGVSIEKTKLPWFVRLDLGVAIPLPRTRADNGLSQRFGPALQSALTGGWELAPLLVASLYGRLVWEAELTIAGKTIDGSSRTDSGVGLALSWRFDPQWTVQAAIDSGLFFDGLGDNQPGRLTSTLGLRYGYF